VNDLKGKKIIICGGAGRMGLNIVTYLENQGALPIIIDKVVNRKFSGTFYQCDLSNFENTKIVLKKILEVHPDVRHMVNALRIRHVDENSDDICRSSALINSGINSYIYPMHLFCNSNLSHGSLVNISSVLGKKISPNVPLDYHVTKAAIEQASTIMLQSLKNIRFV
jgi:NAD(P)-dependent dehydrogenase (short-subunit alcohol dehydrogenase family)